MNLELVVNSKPDGIWIALLSEGKLVELHKEKGKTDFTVGDLYLGRVSRVVPNLNASFVNVGYGKDAFLHYQDLGAQFLSLDKFTQNTIKGSQQVPDLHYFKSEKDIDKKGKIGEVISAKRNVLVQIAKEPISTKGPRLSSEITLAGRYIVLIPFSNKISVSQQIRSAEERERLKDILKSILPKKFGVIIRTVAEGKKIVEIDNDLKDLVAKWKKMHAALRKGRPPKRVLGELNTASSLLRDTLNENFTKIHVNDAALMEQMKEYIAQIDVKRLRILQKYDGKHDIFEHYGINKQIKTLFGKKVPLPSGGYLIIEHTEAMHVVDVNSGNRTVKGDTQEKNALTVNLEAAEELARVMRLRDMGGIICVDFIDMRSRQNNKQLYGRLKELLGKDKTKHALTPPSKFGVVEITRQRVRPVTHIETTEVCPVCKGSGKIQSSLLFADEIEGEINYLLTEKKEPKLALHVHPYLEGYFLKGIFSKRFKWYLKYKKWISVVADSNLHLMEHKFINSNNREIVI